MRRPIAALGALLCLGAAGALLPAAASAAPAPAWALTLTPMPAVFQPGSSVEYLASATNLGAAPTTTEAASLRVDLPATVKPLKLIAAANTDPDAGPFECELDEAPEPALLCETTEAVPPGRALQAIFSVEVPLAAAGEEIEAQAAVAGGGANALEVTVSAPVGEEPFPFDFLYFSAPLTQEDGEAAVLAGSRPHQLTSAFGFPTEGIGGALNGSGHPREVYLELPPGLLGNPAASPVLCTEVELISIQTPGCPPESQVGVIDATTLVGTGGGEGGGTVVTSNLYNMVPPPGAPASLGTDVAGVGIFVHVLGAVRSDSDYGIEAYTRDLLALQRHPIFGVQAQVWGDPTGPSHDDIRGECLFPDVGGDCPVAEPSEIAFLTAPGHCPGTPATHRVRADSWEQPSPPFAQASAEYEAADLQGLPAPIEDCGELDFEPEITARPTTALTDSPSGLRFTLRQPQSSKLGARAAAALRDATIVFPAGMTVNPAQASGLAACSQSEIGHLGGVSFDRRPQSCPEAAKLGTLSASSPLLPRRDAEQKVLLDPAGEPVGEPLGGALYLAEPFENPFGSLIATYVVVEDEQTGIIAKLAGEGELDPVSGQITVRFAENPQLALSAIEVDLFGGSRGPLITPPTCTAHTTEAELVPWSAPEGAAAHPTDSFAPAGAPGGGPCPAAEAEMPNSPALRAGTLEPAAGKYSPLVFELSRADGSQRFGEVEATLPEGLSAKLAGVASCPEAGIAQARSREAPEQGAVELADPSCPASSQLGAVSATAGAGPDPYRAEGRAYLAGPYKGAPLSVVAIAPAIAGPFDLGTVVVRSALYLDPITAQARILSDPLPQIIDGVPLDLRSISVQITRPDFSLNPTSCEEKSFGGQLTSTLGHPAALHERFQVGGCAALPFRPRIFARLFGRPNRGAHPRLRVVLIARPGDANIARLALTLPRSEFIDQAHFRTICTRVQFAANQCPRGSIYGRVAAATPLLDYILRGPVFLRSSSNELPDGVAALRGPAHQPLALEGVARIDSVGGRLRASVQSVPDAPLRKVVLYMQGARKGLFQNSTNLCRGSHRLAVRFSGQNGKVHTARPLLKAKCPKKKQRKRRKHRR